MSNPYAQISRDGLWSNNIVFAQVLALCPTLAVTGTATNGAPAPVAPFRIPPSAKPTATSRIVSMPFIPCLSS